MRARIKATGEIAEFGTGKNLQGETILLKVGTVSLFSLSEVEPIADIDWEQIHIQAAIAAIQGLVSNEIHLNHADKVAEEKGINTSTFLAKCAIDIADALVAELQKKQD